MEVAAYRDPSVLGRKRAFGARNAKTEVSMFAAVGNTERARKLLRQRFNSELLAVRGLLEKALAEEPPAKRIKASPPRVSKNKKVTRGERELLKADLEKLASELPDHIIELLKKQSRGIRGGYMEIDFDAVQEEAVLELRKQLDEFVREREDPSRQEHQDSNTMTGEEDEDVDIVGGVSPLAIASAPLPLAEEEEEEEEEEVYVDICGDASPVVIPKKLDDDATSGTSSDSSSDSGSSSDSDSDSDSDMSIDSPASMAERDDATLLTARAMEYLERSTAREKARQEVLETERAAMPSETIHPTVLKSLGIVEYDYHRARPYSLLPRLGLFLKDDDDQEEQLHRNFDEDLEEGEIRDDYTA